MSPNTTQQTETLTINPAFLQEIKDNNPDLWHTLHQIRYLCDEAGDTVKMEVNESSQPSKHDAAKLLIGLLVQLRELLSLQFALEESYGYIECSHAVDSRISNEAELARGQHYRLYLQISDLCEMAQQLQYSGFAMIHFQQLIDETQAFDEILQQHERDESNLIRLAQLISITADQTHSLN